MEENNSPNSLHLGAQILRFETLGSTNDRARDLAMQGASEGVCVLADSQTAGRGRQGRQWSSPPNTGLYLSIILRPQVTPARAALITLASAIAVAETLILDFQTPADIKYPNDILVKGKKICGILVESSIADQRLEYAILGIGVNVAQKAFPDDLREIATSLVLESKLAVTPEDFLPFLLARLNHWYPLALGESEQVIRRWQALSSFACNAHVRIISGSSITEGITRGLTATGALQVQLDDGSLREIVSGDISLRKAER
jgi:BirA family transcriptional regulator, biotin operon repressor / biotin---[acetyl-CoA-carboxylase] ligase